MQPDANPWSNLDINSDEDQFQFIIVTDRTGGHRPGIFEEAVEKINLLQPEFVMSVGDLIEGYTKDTAILNAEWNEFTGFINDLEMPFFYVPGNHDLTNEVMGKVYLKRFGRDYYHFVYKDVLFLCLNSEDQYRGAGRGSISQPQYEFIEKTLAENEDVRYTFVFLHQPLWIQEDPIYWHQVETLLERRAHTVFAGHYHHYVKREMNNGKYVMLATTGGSSRLRGKDFGEFDHVVWVTMTAETPIIANLWLKGIWDENVSTVESETLIREIIKSNVVQVEPIFVDEPNHVKEDFSIKLTNNLDIPLSIEVEEGFGWDYWVKVDSHRIELQPNSVRQIRGHLKVRQGELDHRKSRPTPIKFLVSAPLVAEDLLQIPIQLNIKPWEMNYLKECTKEISIDGDLDEWELFKKEATATDNEFAHGLTYDDAYLYIAAQVKDDTIVIDTSTSISRQDNIGLYLSFDVAKKCARSPVDAYHLRIAPSAQGDHSSQRLNRIPDDWRYICRQNDTGYNLEVAIPINYLNQQQAGQWQNLRINWVIDDLDDFSDWQQTVRTFIYPSWGSDQEILGSGFYFRDR